jgi:ABC-type multidrug transport system fused ATPase/permease subunit
MEILKKTYEILPKEFRFKVILIFLTSFLAVIFDVLSIALILPLVTILINPDNLSFLNKYFNFDNLISSLDKGDFIIYGVSIFVLLIFLKVVVLILLNIYKANFYYKVKIKMTSLLYQKYLNAEYLFHIYNNSSLLITNLNSEIGLFAKKVLAVFSDIFLDIILFLFLLTILLNIRVYETLIALCTFIIFIFLYYNIIKKRLDYWGKERQKTDRLKIKYLQQSLLGIKDVKLYLKEAFFENILLNIVKKRENITKKIVYISPLPRYLLEIGTVFFILIFTVFFTKNNDNFSLLLPEFALYFASFLRMLPIAIKLINNLQTLKLGFPIVRNLHVELKKEPKLNTITNINQEEISFKKSIKFQNVSFKYPNKSELILENVNLEFGRGKIIGIMGLTGSGKTTFLNLLTTLISPTSGHIFCDDINISQENRNWKKKISYVTQKTFLTDDTIKNNIIFGDETEYNKSKFEEAIKFSNLDNFIKNLPNGINTIVGENGTQMSGGQIQRISIARALYNSPEILVFDEATNSLDEDTEKNIVNEIFALKDRCTIFLITHNRKLTANCDENYLVDKKNIIKI